MTTAQPEPGSAGGPTVLRILLGNQLRTLREANNVTREAAGYEIRASESKISRIELGRVGFKERDVADLLTLYGVTDEKERAALLSLAREANTPGWWHRYGDVMPSWFQSYMGLESAAEMIRTYEVQFVPGLLQTADYARAVICLGHGDASDAEIERRVQLRMDRKRLLTRTAPPEIWFVVDEAALRRMIGGRDVMRAQLEYLIEVAQMSHVRLQVIPFHAGGHAGAGGAFTMLRFPEEELPDVVYVEQLTSALYLDKPEDRDQYALAMEQLCIEAESPTRTVEILDKILQEIDLYHR
ncbi:helix-turn-helix domain-containing protein [Virgisporangium aurantiacum]|uniref:Transcriptional regulator n=1 Tax=Virgisporangium aurantiacum TaxID=175570 RepID=A0A8J3Z517_9ACTN|nr:helix-turn-helix transcriptional regulator [Virgisporangium aurantiacum]GIJ55148.1 transcriptional regulator [Virgisporangium aurantiacum]